LVGPLSGVEEKPAGAPTASIRASPPQDETSTQHYLRVDVGVNPRTASELADLPLESVQQVVARKRIEGSQVGGIVLALRTLQEKHSRDPDEETTRRARQVHHDQILARAYELAPAAGKNERAFLIAQLDVGLSDAEALAALTQWRNEGDGS
jgi:hypothetical protein